MEVIEGVQSLREALKELMEYTPRQEVRYDRFGGEGYAVIVGKALLKVLDKCDAALGKV